MNRLLGMLSSSHISGEQRVASRQAVGVAGRVVWKDARGTARFNSVVIRDVSETGAYIENISGSAIPLFRVVSLQAERTQNADTLPPMLRQGKVLSAVYRVGPFRPATGTPEGYGLRLLIEGRRRAGAAPAPDRALTLATA
ncbi:MAG TPA: hypothetical protein VF332_01440 [Vicinamibacterales bacterium]